ncbi:MAG: carboxylate-amine ligase [Gemmatimonadota bacterium]
MRTDYTIGVEEEYQLVDPDTGALRSRATDVLSIDWSDELRPEMHENTVEIGTPVCTGLVELREELGRQRFQTATAAAAEGLEIVAAGLHPYSRWEGHGIHDKERYEAIAERHDRVARQVQIFGMHIHVGIPERVDRIALMGRVKAFSPHLVALAASSPFVEGEDTGFASYRSILWRLYPYMGMPPHFENRHDYEDFVELLLRSGAIRDRASLYWSVRPHSVYPTLEFRAADVCPRTDDAAVLAELTRLVVAGVAESGLEIPGGRRGSLAEGAWQEILTENEWLTGRYGLDAKLTDPTEPSGIVGVRPAIRSLLDALAPVAREFDALPVLGRVEELLDRGNGADRMRRVYRERQSWDAVVAWLVRETRLGTGFDRRRTQRAGDW